MSLSVKVTGIEKTYQELKHAAEARRKAAANAVNKAALLVQRDAKAICPVIVSTAPYF